MVQCLAGVCICVVRACFCAVLFGVVARATSAELKQIEKGEAPSWIEILDFEVPTEAGARGAPAEILLYDQQDSLSRDNGGDYYFRYIARLLNAEGVRQNAEWSVVYAPEYESVTWHTLRIIRGGEVQDRLPAVKFKELQRELGLETQVMDGRATVVAVLDDVRVGDLIEVAYTKRSANPILRGHILATHFLGAGYPIRRQRVTMRLPKTDPAPYCSFLLPPGTRGLPPDLYRLASLRLALKMEETNEHRIIEWEGTQLPAVVFDGNLPSQAAPYYPMFQATTFRAWSEVAEWGAKLFAASDQLPEEARILVEQWKREHATPAARLNAAVRWVQHDIRYFAMAVGVHNMRPRPLPEVYSSRFGDCKDKALLLASLLRELGFEAWPALVSAQQRERVSEQAPSPFAFDHAIVAYRFDGRLHWLDATMKSQGGEPGHWAVPPYGNALILDTSFNGLVAVNNTVPDEPDTETKDVFTIDQETGEATLHSSVTMRGLQADYYRAKMEFTTPVERSNGWFNFISRFYRELEEVQGPEVVDDPRSNTLTVNAVYRLPHFVKAEADIRIANIYGYALRAYIDPPESRRRHWPYALPNNRFVRHRISFEWPYGELQTQSLPELIVSGGLSYRAEKGVTRNRFVAVHDLRIQNGFVPAENMSAFANAVDDLLSGLSTELRSPASAEN